MANFTPPSARRSLALESAAVAVVVIAVTVVALLPLGLLMGMPFPTGIRIAEQLYPPFVPWGWCANACSTVLGSILAVMLAIQSSLRGRALPRGFIAFGEVGLAGEVRPAPRGQERLKEAAKLGFSVAVVPKANAPKKPIEGLTLHVVERIEQAIDLARSL